MIRYVTIVVHANQYPILQFFLSKVEKFLGTFENKGYYLYAVILFTSL